MSALRTSSREGAFVVHDPAVPLAPEEFVADLAERVRATGRPHAGVRPVTDTVKVLHDGLVGETLDRSGLWQLTGPVVLPAEVPLPATLTELVESLPDAVYVEATATPAPHPPGT